jgi:hypothetical protein
MWVKTDSSWYQAMWSWFYVHLSRLILYISHNRNCNAFRNDVFFVFIKRKAYRQMFPTKILYRIWGSHSGDYEEFYIFFDKRHAVGWKSTDVSEGSRAICFTLVFRLTSTINMETSFSEMSVDFNGLHGVISQKTELQKLYKFDIKEIYILYQELFLSTGGMRWRSRDRVPTRWIFQFT